MIEACFLFVFGYNTQHLKSTMITSKYLKLPKTKNTHRFIGFSVSPQVNNEHFAKNLKLPNPQTRGIFSSHQKCFIADSNKQLIL